MNEQDLILRMQEGDETAFEALVRLYEKKVYTLCRRMCANEEDAQEAAQDTFLAVWRSVGSFRQESSFSTWLYRLATNACIDLLRRNKRSGGSMSLDDEENAIELVDPQLLPQQELVSSVLTSAFPQQQDAFFSSFFLPKPNSDIVKSS